MRKLLFFTAFILFGFASVNAQGRNQLFSLKETQGTPAARADKTSPASVRESEIQINFASMLRGSSARLSITLFDGKTYEAVQETSEGIEMRAMDDFTWRGKIVSGKFTGDVTLTAKKGFMSGLIYSPEAVYEITPRRDKNILMQLDQKLFPPCGGGVPGETSPQETKGQGMHPESPQAGVDSSDRIDVIVIYTTATKNTVGGDTQAQTIAQQAVDAANTAYRNSKIRQRLMLNLSQEYLYTEVDPSTDLSNLRNSTFIQNMRNSSRVDLVDLLEETSAVCGIGYLMGSVAGNSNNAFTVTARSCAVGNLSFAHELGHNMGSAHNPENGSGGTFPYSFGHWVNGSFRTVMSYVDPCTSGCTRVAYFSNPAVIFNGVPTGVENARDNARSIENTADTIANYRYYGFSLTLNSLNNGESVPRNISRTITWSTDPVPNGNVKIELSRDESTNWEILVASTPDDGSQVINISGRPTKRARLRITSLELPFVSDLIANNISKSAIEKTRDHWKSEKFANVVKSIEQAISEITDWKIEFDLNTEPTNLVIRVNNEELDFDVLPDGLRSLISWIADLLGRVDLLKWQDDRPIFEKKLVLLLDEIEVHLHPAWQRKVLPVVQKLFKNSQIFVSTHSPFVVNSIDDAWVYKLRIDKKGKATVSEIVESENSYSITQVLREIFDIEELFGLEVQNNLDKFENLRDKIIANGSNENDENELKEIAKVLAQEPSDQLKQIIRRELIKLSELKGKDFSL